MQDNYCRKICHNFLYPWIRLWFAEILSLNNNNNINQRNNCYFLFRFWQLLLPGIYQELRQLLTSHDVRKVCTSAYKFYFCPHLSPVVYNCMRAYSTLKVLKIVFYVIETAVKCTFPCKFLGIWNIKKKPMKIMESIQRLLNLYKSISIQNLLKSSFLVLSREL